MVNNEPVWVEIDCVGETTGRQYRGMFELKRYLTNREKSDVARLFESYARGITEDMAQRSVLYALAQLNFHVIGTDKCDWWADKGLDLLDDEPVIKLMAELRKMQNPKKETAAA